MQTKGDKYRYVFMPPDLVDLVKRMLLKLQELGVFSKWLFPAAQNPDRPMNGATVSLHFRRAWLGCFPNSKAQERKPTIQGLRHGFVVFRITRWALEGKDVNKMMPYLSKHLGHSSISNTYTYFEQIKHLCPAAKVFLERNKIFNKESYNYGPQDDKES